MRAIETTERRVACPKCGAVAGEVCRSVYGPTHVVHMERKRAFGRVARVTKIVHVLGSIDLQELSLHEIAERIDDALHTWKP